MQSSSTVSGVPLPENIRPGQLQTIRTVDEADALTVAKLPTGYGKTMTFCGGFAVKLAAGVVDYMLYLVPKDTQVHQAAEEVPNELRNSFGINTKSIIVRDHPIPAIKSLKKGTHLVFVTTIQSLATSPKTFAAVNELIRHGRWFFAVDEYHNLPLLVGDKPGRYWSALASLPRAFTLAMSATPRLDNGNDPFPQPDVSVRYRRAASQGYVKPMRLHHYEYRVDGITVNGEVVSFTTTELAEQEDEIEERILKGQMRWSPKYVSPLILIPAERMATYRTHGIRTQMIVRTVSCSHAELVCSQIKAILPTMNVDWVGTGPNGRSDEENRKVIEQFCPEKDSKGRRNWTLDILVQRGIASEGLDTVDVSELVVLAPFNGTVQDLQFSGRGSRKMKNLKGEVIEIFATVSVDSSTKVAKDETYLGDKFMDIFDADNLDDEDDDADDYITGDDDKVFDPDDKFLPEEPVVVLADVSLVNIKTEPGYKEMYEALRSDPGAAHKTDEECEELVARVLRQHIAARDDSLNTASVLKQLQGQITNSVSKIVSRILRRMAKTGISVERTLPGDLAKRIRTQAKKKWGSLESLDESELRDQYQWLVELEKNIAADDRSKTAWLL